MDTKSRNLSLNSMHDTSIKELAAEDFSPGESITEDFLNCITETVCIITDKVYAHCQSRECFPNVEINIGDKKVCSIKFGEGFIVDGTLNISEIPNRPNFKRVRFTLRIPFEVRTTDGEVITGFLPDVIKDIVLFMPESRDEFDFKIVIETASRILGQIQISCDGIITFAVGTFIIIKVVGRVQLLIPAFGFCPEPPECEDFTPGDICDVFEFEEFPDFFPPQFEDLFPDD
ncbi:hypothetical protein CLPU_1c00590 [Gottschalkia purinilytica]|uniref:Uncharacterized protein n=1 Tax=Gottschalkia purinilytica TaxID=1503 RepID=A0A0L0WEK1_GOTPU|nr:hypothetical protein [Gottschalkia purinilytica]KNF09894.1 hypothetical protein CLPU_1c00590 [Gottschalkia purinilytica]